MKRFIVIALAGLGALVALGVVAVVIISLIVVRQDPLPARLVLELDLRDGVVETSPTDPLLLAIEGRRLLARDVVEGLHRAADDDRVEALWVRGGDGVGGWAMTEELRNAVLRFRESGKPAHYFTESFGEIIPAQGAVHLATAFDRITVQPTADVGLAPLVVEMPFLRGALERLDIDPRFEGREEYKDVVDMFVETEFTDASEEALRAVLETLEGRIIEGIADGRGLSPDQARQALHGGPWSAPEALEMGLVDVLGYEDESRAAIRELAEDAEFAGLRAYRQGTRGSWDGRGPRVALVYATGPIMRGTAGFDLLGGASMGSATVAKNLRDAAERPGVEAILFRVDSPGGSYVASDQIRREVKRASDNGIPVVVSMGNSAASGGYLISLDADRIVAHPSTVTGSIGVAGGKLVTGEFLSRYGINFDHVTLVEDEVGGFSTATGDFSDEEWARFQDQLDRIYDGFVNFVAEGRGLSLEQADVVARGRVWTGQDALDRGLVDALGGLPEALDEIRILLELEADDPLRVTPFPGEPSLLELILEETRGVSTSSGDLSTGLSRIVRFVGAVGRLGDPAAGGTTRMAPMGVPGS